MPENLALLVPTFWLGILIGISFIATPVKFQAASLTRPVALDIGRATFRFFSRIEWLLAALLFGAETVAKGAAWRWPLAVVVAAIVLAQAVWLLPALDQRAAGIISGTALAPSPAHRVYGALEGLKLLALLALIAAGFTV
jgi:hypothetical protein